MALTYFPVQVASVKRAQTLHFSVELQ